MTQYIIIGGIALVVLFAAVYIKMTIDEKRAPTARKSRRFRRL